MSCPPPTPPPPFPDLLLAAAPTVPVLPPVAALPAPLTIGGVEVFQLDENVVVRVTLDGGTTGWWLAQHHATTLLSVLCRVVAPFYVGRDAREVARLPHELYRRHYKLTGMALWSCVAMVEAAVLDALGHVLQLPVSALLGPVLRRSLPVYLSSMERRTTPEQEVACFERALAETGARALKVKIGGRFSGNADAAPGRTPRLVELCRRRFPDLTLLADANSSYDAPAAIAVGRWLEQMGVSMFEEPCPWEDLEATARVADALQLPVSGGEQDTSLDKLAWMARRRAVDVLQPDLMYAGGLTRGLTIAAHAAAAGLPVVPHNAAGGSLTLLMLHFAAVVPNLFPFQELNLRGGFTLPPWTTGWRPTLTAGALTVPTTPGLGLTFDPHALTAATRLFPA